MSKSTFLIILFTSLFLYGCGKPTCSDLISADSAMGSAASEADREKAKEHFCKLVKETKETTCRQNNVDITVEMMKQKCQEWGFGQNGGGQGGGGDSGGPSAEEGKCSQSGTLDNIQIECNKAIKDFSTGGEEERNVPVGDKLKTQGKTLIGSAYGYKKLDVNITLTDGSEHQVTYVK